MKQRISIEQLQELTEEQQHRLREWWKPEFGDMLVMPPHTTIEVIDEELFKILQRVKLDYNPALPLLSIGQLIELLNGLDLDGETEQSINDGIMWINDNLCDALWSAVKKVL
jgi:hypothetical protein